ARVQPRHVLTSATIVKLWLKSSFGGARTPRGLPVWHAIIRPRYGRRSAWVKSEVRSRFRLQQGQFRLRGAGANYCPGRRTHYQAYVISKRRRRLAGPHERSHTNSAINDGLKTIQSQK